MTATLDASPAVDTSAPLSSAQFAAAVAERAALRRRFPKLPPSPAAAALAPALRPFEDRPAFVRRHVGGIEIVPKGQWVPDRLRHGVLRLPVGSHLGQIVWSCLRYVPAEQAAELIDALTSVCVYESRLGLAIVRRDGAMEWLPGTGWKVVTNAGVDFIVDAFQNSVELENMKFHGLGTGSTAEAAGDTALVTELTTQYTGNVRATGSTTEGGSSNVYRTVATNTLDETPGAALREHGVFSASSAGTLFDRTVYAAITLVSGEGLQSTYDGQFSAGG